MKGLKKKFLAIPLTAITAVTMAIATSAESVADDSMKATLETAGAQLTTSFSDMISTIVPVVLGIVGSGLVIFGIVKLVGLAKKIFGKVAG